MKRIVQILSMLGLFFLGIGVAEAATTQLKINDITNVVDRFFHFHIESHDWHPALVRRFMKVYVEQFDPDKSYLLESEILSYLNLSDKECEEITHRLRAGDYSDLQQMTQLFQRAILRFQSNRAALGSALVDRDAGAVQVIGGVHSRFARTQEELLERQRAHMVRFFLFHLTRTRLDSRERKTKVFALFDKKVRRMENNYLYLDGNGKAMERARVEHLFSLRILKAFAKSLDTHTSFFSPEEAQEMRLNLEKQFEGVGIILSEGIDGIMIAELIEGSPAQQNGSIAINDLLVEIDGKEIEPLSFAEVLDLLKKKDRGHLSLGFKRVNTETGEARFFRVDLLKRPIVMQGERIETSYVKVKEGIIGKISLHSFYESSDGISSEKDIKEAILAFRDHGELVGLVLDLRENSGGFLSQAVKVAGLFLSNGVVVISKYGHGEIHYLRNIVARNFYSGPLVVLTSKMSASAAEIVAQALQDYGVALVVGDLNTFGKGSIQYQTITDEKAEYFFKITVGRYYTPSGRSTQIEGVIADIVLPGKYAPYKIGERYLEFALTPDQASPAFVDPLSDLDQRARQIFEKRYMPYLQRVVSYWKKMLPVLRQNSAERIATNREYQSYLRKQQGRSYHEMPVNSIDDQLQVGLDDLQMQEAVEIVKDMIEMEARQTPHAAALLPTGS
ncbi:MAG: PDZ domain-containing protein [Chlamydiia bacterium]|nr:PDZ domain-containing protein [Chlamydiia bacterium]